MTGIHHVEIMDYNDRYSACHHVLHRMHPSPWLLSKCSYFSACCYIAGQFIVGVGQPERGQLAERIISTFKYKMFIVPKGCKRMDTDSVSYNGLGYALL